MASKQVPSWTAMKERPPSALLSRRVRTQPLTVTFGPGWDLRASVIRSQGMGASRGDGWYGRYLRAGTHRAQRNERSTEEGRQQGGAGRARRLALVRERQLRRFSPLFSSVFLPSLGALCVPAFMGPPDCGREALILLRRCRTPHHPPSRSCRAGAHEGAHARFFELAALHQRGALPGTGQRRGDGPRDRADAGRGPDAGDWVVRGALDEPDRGAEAAAPTPDAAGDLRRVVVRGDQIGRANA